MTDKEKIKEDVFILDSTCGFRSMWINKQHPNTLYMDIREHEKEKLQDGTYFEVKPDIIADFRKTDFPNKRFKLIVFDPPQFISLGDSSMFAKRYGKLNKNTWKDDLTMAFRELWRILDDYGVLIFKWNDYEIPYKEVLSLCEHEPLFGQRFTSRGKSKTYWFTFMKIPKNKSRS